ncbi:glycosyltransferase family 2 protein [Celeribacter neptunius]|uniref:Glycosyltransferase like family 2 n=1 Tax=Celeribacter neptunius TaxID=588602 RepID=A0A1I3SWT2_9RHOB|nr:glycosyltransferase [Celeribacter neptunius]SFJ62662.1 Glycosyltransferase like family 2 [Celeribacter neptunius]
MVLGSEERQIIDVVVPVYRHWQDLYGLLNAFDQQTLDQTGFTINIVANEPVPEGVKGQEWLRNAKLVECLKPGSYAARNFGAALGVGRLLYFTDADCRPHPDCLSVLLQAHKAQPGAILVGQVQMVEPKRETLWSTLDMVRGIPQDQYVSRGYGAGASLAIPREIFTQFGGFDTQRFSGADAEFCRRVPVPVCYVPEAIVSHPCRASFHELFRKARRLRGGQLLAGAPGRRIAWGLLSVLPPVREMYQLWQRPFSVGKRIRAIVALNLIWGLLVIETMRLLVVGRPERQ